MARTNEISLIQSRSTKVELSDEGADPRPDLPLVRNRDCVKAGWT